MVALSGNIICLAVAMLGRAAAMSNNGRIGSLRGMILGISNF
jgi:hypothetical protein